MKISTLTSLSVGLLLLNSAYANTVNVDCISGHELSVQLASATPNSTYEVSGTCFGPLTISVNDITLVGNQSGTKAILKKSDFIPFPQDVVTVDGATRVVLSGFEIQNGLSGVHAKANASVTIKNSEITDNIIGLTLVSANTHLEDVSIQGTAGSPAAVGIDMSASSLYIDGTVDISGVRAFGISALSNSSIRLNQNSTLNTHHNLLGGQVSLNSSFFADTGAQINAHDNFTIGFSINTGSSGMLFNANMTARNNGLDGLDVVSASNFEVDGESQLIAEFNGREGVSIDNSTFNMFGFFSGVPGLPNVTANNNTINGVHVESTSKFDVGRNASVTALNNGNAGVLLDDGSSAIIQRADINDNNADFGNGNGAVKADMVATFGSRVTFLNDSNSVGLLSCDNTSMARGDVKCK